MVEPPKDPTGYDLLTYAWVLALSLWGGTVNFWRKMKTGKSRPFNVVEFVGELVTSGFTGLLTFYLCQSADFNMALTAFLVGISGHMGSKALMHAEALLEKYAARKTDSLP